MCVCVAIKAGIAESMVKPAFAMYKAERAVRIGDAVAFGRTPRFGFPAGFAFATFIMALVTQPWTKQFRSKPSVRPWMEDCTAFVQGDQAAIGMAGAASRAADGLEKSGMKVNSLTSGTVGTTTLQTRMMQLAAGPKFGSKEPLKDLGVI